MKKLLLTLLLSFTFLFSAININTASKEELMSIKGVGEKTAEYIIDYRKDKKFEKIEDIKNIKGIGDKKFEVIKDDITISGKTITKNKDNNKDSSNKR
ncbi:competence protein, ComEA family [Campylobacter blaseri]|nr:helix-hairpin-helix domain-containing protein [Campylobacter blaseri]QKF86462.1 competence protein, ComEA family [Campylobacter blaseri]QKF86742.1 competence protein, ComEA family [Campylobacter blaseri]